MPITERTDNRSHAKREYHAKESERGTWWLQRLPFSNHVCSHHGCAEPTWQTHLQQSTRHRTDAIVLGLDPIGGLLQVVSRAANDVDARAIGAQYREADACISGERLIAIPRSSAGVPNEPDNTVSQFDQQMSGEMTARCSA